MKNEQPDWYARLIDEASELTSKMAKLRIFMSTDIFKTLPESHKGVFHGQYYGMASYQAALEMRIAIGWE